MNLANKLTVFRMILVVVLVIVSLLNIQGAWLNIGISFWIINIIFSLASLTDQLDGYIARKRNEVTTFGKFLDPLADKILVLTTMIILVERGLIPGWIPIIVLAREFIVSGYRLIAVEKGGKVIAASIWGKIKTVTQMIAIILALFNINGTNIYGNFITGNLTGIELVVNVLTTSLLTISVIATVFSGWDYLNKGKELFKD